MYLHNATLCFYWFMEWQTNGIWCLERIQFGKEFKVQIRREIYCSNRCLNINYRREWRLVRISKSKLKSWSSWNYIKLKIWSGWSCIYFISNYIAKSDYCMFIYWSPLRINKDSRENTHDVISFKRSKLRNWVVC